MLPKRERLPVVPISAWTCWRRIEEDNYEADHGAEADQNAEDDLQVEDDSLDEDDGKKEACSREDQGAHSNYGGVKPCGVKKKKSVVKSASWRRDTSMLSQSKKSKGRKAWSKEEERAIYNDPDCSTAIQNMYPPSFKTCAKVKATHPCLKDRTIVQIKSKVWNAVQKKKKTEEMQGIRNNSHHGRFK